MNHFPVLLLRNLHALCASQAGACVLCAKLLQCCCPRTWPARVPGAMQREASTFLTHHIAPFTLHIWALFIWFHVFPYVSYVLLGYFHVIWAQLKLSHALDLALLHVSKVERNSCRFFYMPKGVDHKIFTILRSLVPSVFVQKKFFHREAFLYIITTGIAAPKPDLDAKATKRRFWSIFLKDF